MLLANEIYVSKLALTSPLLTKLTPTTLAVAHTVGHTSLVLTSKDMSGGTVERGPTTSIRAYDAVQFESELSPLPPTSVLEAVKSAAEGNDFEVVRYAVETGKVGINTPLDVYRNTILHHAARLRNVSAVRFALEAGGDVHARNDDSSSVLRAAAIGGCAEIVAILLAAKASPAVGTDSGSTPLHQAVDRGHSAVVRVLLGAGADFNLPDASGVTPVMIALSKWQTHTLRPAAEALDAMMAAGHVAWGMRNASGDSLLHMACRNGKLALVAPVLSQLGQESDAAAPNDAGETLLHVAVQAPDNAGHFAALLALDGMDPLATDAGGNTILHSVFMPVPSRGSFAAGAPPDQRVASIVDDLFSVYGSSLAPLVNAFNHAGHSPLLLALMHSHVPDALQILVDHGADVALPPGKVKKGRSLPGSPATANVKGLSPLLYAIKTKHVAVVEVLLTSPALDINAVREKNTKRSVLHAAVKSGDPDKVTAVLDAGVDVSILDRNGKSARDIARKETVIRVLDAFTSSRKRMRENDTDQPRAPATSPISPAMSSTNPSTNPSANPSAMSSTIPSAMPPAKRKKLLPPHKRHKYRS